MAKRVCDPTSGSIANETYLIGRNGQVVRTRAVPQNPNTTAQVLARKNLASASQMWRSITAAQRLAWTSTAAGVQSKTRLGQSGPLTGEQLFCKLNAALALMELPLVADPPELPTFPALAPQSLIITNTGGDIDIQLECPTDPSDATAIRAAAPVSAGIARLPRVAFIGVCPAAVAGYSDITGLYTSRYGAPPVGSRVFVVANMIVDGWESPKVAFNAVVPAAGPGA